MRRIINLGTVLFFSLIVTAAAAPIDNVRSSISSARVRIVLDSKEQIKYTADKKNLRVEVNMPQSSAKAVNIPVKDQIVKSVALKKSGDGGSRLEIDLSKDSQYKVYRLPAPDRLVIDIYRINIMKQTEKIAAGVEYTFMQDEFSGRQIQAHIVSVAPDARYELRPFSAAGSYNGLGSLAKEAARRELPVAVNASYFDTDGWVIGSTKDHGKFLSMDEQRRSGYIALKNKRMLARDLQYTGKVRLPGAKYLQIKGMNRSRLTDDFILYNEHFAESTKTNAYGYEVKIKGNKVVAVSSAGNMKIEQGTVVLSGHGIYAQALAKLKLGDTAVIFETLGTPEADKAETVIGGGPLLLENGKINVRTLEENIAADIAIGRAPRTAVGLKKDGTLILFVVDGRSKLSSGMTLEEIAMYMLRLGVKDAVNFDGGGSSEMIIRGRIVNRPSDGRERRISMGMGLFPI